MKTSYLHLSMTNTFLLKPKFRQLLEYPKRLASNRLVIHAFDLLLLFVFDISISVTPVAVYQYIILISVYLSYQ